MVVCQLHFEPEYLLVNKKGQRVSLTKDAIPTIFDAKPLTQTVIQKPTLREVASSSNEQAKNPGKPKTCVQCIHHDVTIQALNMKITLLQATCTERQEIIDDLRKEIRILRRPNPIIQRICPVCNEEFPSHRINQHRCKISYLRGQHYESTVSVHHMYECFVCKMECESFKATQHHIIKYHRRNTNCSVCSQDFTMLEFEMHICTGLKSLNCSYCQQEFTTTKNLLQHLYDCNKSEKLTWKCDYCQKYFFMESLMSIHMENHENNKDEFFCNVCTKSFAKKHLLRMHKKRAHFSIGRKYAPLKLYFHSRKKNGLIFIFLQDIYAMNVEKVHTKVNST